MRRQQPDRVPLMCQLALGHYFLNTPFDSVSIWHSSETFVASLFLLQERYGFDGILLNLPGRNPNWRSDIAGIEERGNQKIIRWRNGWTTVCPADDNPHVFRPDGSRFFARFADVQPETLYYVEPHDLSGITYPFSWGLAGEPARPPDFFPPWHFAGLEAALQRAAAEVSVHAEIFSPFSQFLELLDIGPGLSALLEDPGKCRACLENLALGAARLGRMQAQRGADALLISSAFAGAGFISRPQYEQFVLPYERSLIAAIKAEHDLPVYTHTCGRIGDRLDLLEATGTDGIDTLDPPPLGDVHLEEAKKRVGGRLFLKGNIDPVNVMLNGTPERVFTEARRCLEIAAAGGGYVLSSACSLPPRTPPANIMKLREAVEAFGNYRHSQKEKAATQSTHADS